MKESTYGKTLKLFRSLPAVDKANIVNEILVDYRYNEVEQRVLAHHLDEESWECIDNMTILSATGGTAHDLSNARRKGRAA